MKNFLLLALVIVPSLMSAQLGTRRTNSTFDVVSNDPLFDPAFTLNFELIHGQIGPSTNGAFATANFGMWGNGQPTERFGIDYITRLSYLSLILNERDQPMRYQAEIGGYFVLHKGLRTINTRLVLHHETQISGKVEYTSKGVARKVPTTIYSNFMLRAGYMSRGDGKTFDYEGPVFAKFEYLQAQMNSQGIYFGGMLRYTMNTYLSSSWGLQTNAKVIEVYGDIITFPAITFENLTLGNDFGEDISSEVEQFSSDIPEVGWRLGIRSYQVQKMQKGTNNRKGKPHKKAIFIGVSAEIGNAPYRGLYGSCGFSLSVLKKNRRPEMILE